MGMVRGEIEITGKRKSKKLMALFDSGAGRNFINKTLGDGSDLEKYIGGFISFREEVEITIPNKSKIFGNRVGFKKIRIQERSFDNVEFILMKEFAEFVEGDAIIGATLMQKLGISLDLSNEKIIMIDDIRKD